MALQLASHYLKVDHLKRTWRSLFSEFKQSLQEKIMSPACTEILFSSSTTAKKNEKFARFPLFFCAQLFTFAFVFGRIFVRLLFYPFVSLVSNIKTFANVRDLLLFETSFSATFSAFGIIQIITALLSTKRLIVSSIF